MARIKYSNGSPYAATPQTSWHLENLVLRDIRPDSTDKPMIIENKYHLRPDNLSHALYGSRDYWWIFQILNMDKIRDPIYDFKSGTLIFVPTKERLLNTLGANRI